MTTTIQEVDEYSSLSALSNISIKIRQGWFVKAMTSYSQSEYSIRTIVVYEKIKSDE